MGLVSLTTITNGTLADAGTIMGNYNAIANQVNGHIDGANIDPAAGTILGLTTGTTVRSGSCVVPGLEGTASPTYTLLPTPDRVSAISVGSAGLLAVFYEAAWIETVGQASRAAIFIGGGPGNTQTAQQLKVMNLGTQQAYSSLSANTLCPLSTFPMGLQAGGSQPWADVTTGHPIGVQGSSAFQFGSSPYSANSSGGVCFIQIGAGTYDVSIQFLCASGTVSARNRRLYVKAIGF